MLLSWKGKILHVLSYGLSFWEHSTSGQQPAHFGTSINQIFFVCQKITNKYDCALEVVRMSPKRFFSPYLRPLLWWKGGMEISLTSLTH